MAAVLGSGFVAALANELGNGRGIDTPGSAHHHQKAVFFGGRAQRSRRNAQFGRGFVDGEQSRHRSSGFRLLGSRLGAGGIGLLNEVADA